MQRGELAIDSTRSKLWQRAWWARRIILVSNRGAVEHRLDEGGRLVAQRGRGGLVSAITPLAARTGAIWVAAAMGEGDRYAAQAITGRGLCVSTDTGRFWQRLVVLPPHVYQQYYSVFSNPLLWFLQHKLWNLLSRPNIEKVIVQSWREGYVPANRAFAEAITAAAQGDPAPVVMLHDYHLYLASGYLRAQLPAALLHHFVHIPWPAPGYWQPLPPAVRQAICAGLVANDVVGFQTHQSAYNFLRTCRSFLPGARVNEDRGTITRGGHTTRIRVYPISVDVGSLRRIANSHEVHVHLQRLASRAREKTIVRVDRLDPAKNVALGFRAFDLLLNRRPELSGRVRFLAFLVPSRTGIPEYQRYTQETLELADYINRTHGRGDWQPIRIFHENNLYQSIAGLQLYDVLLINSVADGMNLVAKEGSIINRRDGVLVLSRTTGAYEQLGEAAVTIDPMDVEGTAEALALAIEMPAAERAERAARLRALVEREDLNHWIGKQIEDLQALIEGSS